MQMLSSPVKVRHDCFGDISTCFLQNADGLRGSSFVPPGVDDDWAAELGLSVGGGSQDLLLTLCDWPASTDLTNHSTANVCTVCSVQHLADNNVSKLEENGFKKIT